LAALVRFTILLAALAQSAACFSGAIVGREMLADPAMRFQKTSPLVPYQQLHAEPDRPPAPDSVESYLNLSAEPGADVRGLYFEQLTRAAVELGGGFGLEGGYGAQTLQETVLKLDGFAAPYRRELVRHGPDAALLIDDGSNLLRAGYRLRLSSEGNLHQASLRGRSTVLAQDMLLELGYRYTWQEISIGRDLLPAAGPVGATRSEDFLSCALEKGWLPAWALRLELELERQQGFLQNPWRLVSLWSPRGQDGSTLVPASFPENHPPQRFLWAAAVRLHRGLAAGRTVLELGGGAGSDSWRVEHQHLQAAWKQRLGSQWLLELSAGGYHQTRAYFYRNDYTGPAPGAWWSADRSLAAQWGWWVAAGANWTRFASRGRLLGMFKYVTLEGGLVFLQLLYARDGLDAPSAFSGWDSAGGGNRRAFAGGDSPAGWMRFEGGF
jgi:hypothetical protein